jgi:type IV pilus assembly protein PilA
MSFVTNYKPMPRQKGFTLIELLIVIGIIAFLASAIFIAVDPAKRFAEARNARRWTDVSSILEAVLEYAVDNGGSLPAGIDNVPGTSQVLGTAATGCDTTCTAKTTVAACLDLSSALVDQYLSAIPQDPLTGTASNTDYYINKTAKGRIEVGACDPELGATIYVSR